MADRKISELTATTTVGSTDFTVVVQNGTTKKLNIQQMLSFSPGQFSGAYADLSGKPTLFSGNYVDLTGKPALFSGAYDDLSGKPTLYVPETPTYETLSLAGTISESHNVTYITVTENSAFSLSTGSVLLKSKYIVNKNLFVSTITLTGNSFTSLILAANGSVKLVWLNDAWYPEYASGVTYA